MLESNSRAHIHTHPPDTHLAGHLVCVSMLERCIVYVIAKYPLRLIYLLIAPLHI